MPLPFFNSLDSFLKEREPFCLDDYGAERESVRKILDAVRRGGDGALKELTARFEGAVLKELRVSEAEM